MVFFNKKHIVSLSLCLFIWHAANFAKGQDLVNLYQYRNDAQDLRAFLFTGNNHLFRTNPPADNYLTNEFSTSDTICYKNSCSGDFTGDGVDEIALFTKKMYSPNCLTGYRCDPFYVLNIQLLKPYDGKFINAGSFYEAAADKAAQWVATGSGNLNNDERKDLAYVTAGGSDSLSLHLLHSQGNKFTETTFHYPLPAACSIADFRSLLIGNFTDDQVTDIVLACKSTIYLFKNNGVSYSAPVLIKAYNSTTEIQYPCIGRFKAGTRDGIGFLQSAGNSRNYTVLTFSEGTTALAAEDVSGINCGKIFGCSTLNYNDDGLTDLVMMVESDANYPNKYRMVSYSNADGVFTPENTMFETNIEEYNFNKVRCLLSGNFRSDSDFVVCKWKNDKAGALTFSFDDGYANTITQSTYLYSKHLKGTHNIISHLSGTDDYAPWQLIENDTSGNEYGSHSAYHVRLGLVSTDKASEELLNSKTEIEKHSHKPVLSFVYPGGSFNQEVLRLPALRENYLSARSSMIGYNVETPTDFYALKARVVVSDTRLSAIEDWVKATERYGYWTFLMFHYLGYSGSDTDLADYNYPVNTFREVVDYVEQANVWTETQANVTKYIRERNAVQLTVNTWNSNETIISLNDHLDDTRYDCALTVKHYLPANMDTDTVYVYDSSMNMKQYAVIKSCERPYVLFDAFPDNTAYTIRYFKYTTSQKTSVYTGVQVYPNPVTDYLIVQIPKNENIGRISVCNLSGKCLINSSNVNVGENRLDLKALLSGLYFLRLYNTAGKLTETLKFVKKQE